MALNQVGTARIAARLADEQNADKREALRWAIGEMLSPQQKLVLGKVAEGIQESSAIADAVSMRVDQVSRTLSELFELHLVRREQPPKGGRKFWYFIAIG